MSTKDNLETAVASLDALMKLVEGARGDEFGDSIPADIVMAPYAASYCLIEAREHLLKAISAVDAEYQRPPSPSDMCQCKGGEDDEPYDISGCPRHTVDHPYKQGCCDQPDKIHRHMSDAEYTEAFPVLLDKTTPTTHGRYNVEVRRYTERTGVTVTYLFDSEEPSNHGGLCFDLPLDALRAIMPTLEEACGLDA